MPIHARVSMEIGLVVLVLEGVITTEDVQNQVTPLIDSPEISLLPLALIDATRAERGDAPSATIHSQTRRAAENIDHKIDEGAKMAIVATSDEFFGLGRMYASLREGSPVDFQVFRSLPDAEHWLGLDANYASKLSDID